MPQSPTGLCASVLFAGFFRGLGLGYENMRGINTRTGIGQEVDVSIPEAAVRALHMESVFLEFRNTLVRREGRFIMGERLRIPKWFVRIFLCWTMMKSL